MEVEKRARRKARQDERFRAAYSAELHAIQQEKAGERMRRIALGLEQAVDFNLYVPSAEDNWEL